jgi:hypothetical protein
MLLAIAAALVRISVPAPGAAAAVMPAASSPQTVVASVRN